MSEILFSINGMNVTLGVLVAVLSGLAVFLLAGLLFAQGRQSRVRALEAQEQSLRVEELQQRVFELLRVHSETSGRVQSLAEGVGNKQEELTRSVNQRLDTVTQRLGDSLSNAAKETAESLSKLNERLAVVDAAQSRMSELSSSMVKLNDVLANKQSRGAFGQGRMEAIISDGLPKNAYEFQFTLKNRNRPDCIIRVPGDDRVFVIDAKFPLESLTAFRKAQTDEERSVATKGVKNDISVHITNIADRYIVQGETQDVALMFVPSESIYADLHEFFDDVIQKAHKRRVLLVSPTLLMLAIQVIRTVIQDAKMREQAEVIQLEVGKLMGDVRKLNERAQKVQSHFGHLSENIVGISTSAERIFRHGQRIAAVEFDEKEGISSDSEGVVTTLKLTGQARE
ncbi:MAG: DNA recombination protein RmuC [Xanthobacteraceae bacterium]|nr:DNA recombination protein RmuC [Xanthobacteraceae bacterium]